MKRARLLVVGLVAMLAVVTGISPVSSPKRAAAQLTAAPVDAGGAAPPASAPVTAPTSASSGDAPARPPPGPALRERNARRRGNPAGGAFMLVLLVGALVYGVGKWIKRRL